ncbi:MAG: prolyl oligopeptidase family serine peptidase [Thermoguttaceae bacterium]|nr:prolyl oligopeptidase family serine peptidase [Thermoguttaceae bacterium]MDW8038477.1 prolyl oligopeptidase family serine peptidase [Thermoguttaceae bacterium]
MGWQMIFAVTMCGLPWIGDGAILFSVKRPGNLVFSAHQNVELASSKEKRFSLPLAFVHPKESDTSKASGESTGMVSEAKEAEQTKEMVEKELAQIRSQTKACTYTDAQGKKLLYRLWVPRGYDPGKKYPLILFLHGAGERGDDNLKQLAIPDVLHWVRDKYAKEHPSFLVAPQCPAGAKWVDVNWWQLPHHQTPPEPSEPMRLTMELLDALQKEFSIDPDRIYVTGLSMGGYGTFDLLVRRPKYFAAAVPICGGADDSRAKDFAHVPIWIFHGAKDQAVPVVRSRSIVEALRKAGGQPRYTEYPDGGHAIWQRVYADEELARWLFQQVRSK